MLGFARPSVRDRPRGRERALYEAARDRGRRLGDRRRLDLDPALPAAPTDGERLRLALVNILANARHAIAARKDPPPGPDPIRVTTAARGSRLVIGVTDRGPGIAPDDLPRIFDPYFTTRRTGTGLGLAISRNIIEGLGGTIAISAAGQGTEVRIDLRSPEPPCRACHRATWRSGAWQNYRMTSDHSPGRRQVEILMRSRRRFADEHRSSPRSAPARHGGAGGAGSTIDIVDA